MSTRPLNERLKIELDFIRSQLIEATEALTTADLDWAPAPDMKSFRKILIEIGVAEIISLRLMCDGTLTDWDIAWGDIEKAGVDAPSLMATLADIRSETIEYLASVGDDALSERITIPEQWAFAFGGTAEVEREELIREIAQHEYYHVGQIVTYRWAQGHNPYTPG